MSPLSPCFAYVARGRVGSGQLVLSLVQPPVRFTWVVFETLLLTKRCVYCAAVASCVRCCRVKVIPIFGNIFVALKYIVVVNNGHGQAMNIAYDMSCKCEYSTDQIKYPVLKG